MREIGSEFWDIPVKDRNNSLFPECTQWYLSGRSALKAIIDQLEDAKSVALPAWCCDSMIQPFLDAGKDVCFYPVYWQNGLIQEINAKCDVLLIMDYFGYSSSWPALKNYTGIVIRDVTHSIFSNTYSDADYFFGSLRKWCGVWSGGYAWARDGLKLGKAKDESREYIYLRQMAMAQKAEYIIGDREDKGYLKFFDEAEALLDRMGIGKASERDIDLSRHLDVEGIRKKRISNANVLRNAFPSWLMFREMSPNDIPMFVPVLVPDGRRNELRRYLIEKEIYCPVHWPLSALHSVSDRTRVIYDNELSLVCDQRYTEDDMSRMVEQINVFMEV